VIRFRIVAFLQSFIAAVFKLETRVELFGLNLNIFGRKVYLSAQTNKISIHNLHVCTVHQQYQSILLFHNDAHNHKITGILKQL
jgi:hypothetical protein